MGGAVSAGETNDELIDNLVEAEYIKTEKVERIFHAVDRGAYYLPTHRDMAYKDLAWKNGNLHLSAPCIYAEVMESLELKRGHSFLNLGSGTGYLSTLVGLIIGPYGVNHGVELHADVVQYAYDKLEEFKSKNECFDLFEFCEPEFVVGNCLLLSTGGQLYDRVYCGAACPWENVEYIKTLIKIGGILVMPLQDQLVQFKKIDASSWEQTNILPVSFATLVQPMTDKSAEIIELPEVRVNSLQAICRLEIRRLLRENILKENPNLSIVRPSTPPTDRKKRGDRLHMADLQNMGMVVMGSGYDTEDDDDDDFPEPEGVSTPIGIQNYMSYLLHHHRPPRAQVARTHAHHMMEESQQTTDSDDSEDDSDDDKEEGKDDEEELGDMETSGDNDADACDNGTEDKCVASQATGSNCEDSQMQHEDEQPSSGEANNKKVVQNEGEGSSSSKAIPISQLGVNNDWNRSASLSTSCTSGVGTCSSVEDHVEMDFTCDLATHVEEVDEGVELRQDHHDNSSPKPTSSKAFDLRVEPTNGFHGETVKTEVHTPDTHGFELVSPKNGSKTEENCRIADNLTVEEGGSSGHKEETRNEEELMAAGWASLPTQECCEEAEESMGDNMDDDTIKPNRKKLVGPPAGLLRKTFNSKIELLPIPVALRNFVAYYRE